MRRHAIPKHDREFLIIANRAIQDPRISHTARGILALVLSLPDGHRTNVRTLSDDYPQGRSAVAKAVEELRKLGYWVTKTGRDSETNRIVSTVDVYELPSLATVPVPTRPVTTPVATRNTGTSPNGEKDVVKDGKKNNPPNPPVEPQTAPEAPREGSSEQKTENGPQAVEAARILRRFAAIDSRLKLNDRQVKKLIPQVADWLDRGATIGAITDAVTQGLPAKVYSAGHLISDRLDRKRPERKRQWKAYAECPCGNLLPAGQDSGICAECALGTGSTVFEIDCTTGEITDHGDFPEMPNVAARASELRALMRA
ncbi:hypothetical protein ACFYW8_15175 [Streptomyces sp. NPDC002742]|uniref:hypothetical protein n=1 Tax=Streptomyces sp. NPDC002742 TaxID=3364663 RepID=UPI00369B2D6A